MMDRHWLLTSTFYGNWLPGDRRGFVGRMRDRRQDDLPRQSRREHDTAGTAYDRDIVGLRRSALELMKCDPIRVNADQAHSLVTQFLETARYRGWQLVACSVMSDHVHWVVGVPGDPDPEKLLGNLKSYGSRALNKRWAKPASDTWWTEGGSKRILNTSRRLLVAVIYVAFKQPNPLARCPEPTFVLPERYDKLRATRFDEKGFLRASGGR